MNKNDLSGRYAKALFQLAEKRQYAETLFKRIEILIRAFRDLPRFPELLQSPIINKSEKMLALERLLPNQEDEFLKEFLLVLVQKNRIGLWNFIFKNYEKLMLRKNNQEEVKIISARKLDEDLRARLVSALEKITGKKIVCDIQEDKGLIGGIQVRIANRLIDGSVRTKLNELKLALATASIA